MPPVTTSLEEMLAQASWLRGLAASLVREGASAEDLVQETWLRALRHPPQAGESPRPWLARVARNLASNLRRTEVRREEHEAAFRRTDPELDPSVLLEEVEAQRVLAEAVLRLEEPLRTAVVLRYERGLDSREIGRLQGAPAGTVRWRLKRALELLRADLDRRFGERSRWRSTFTVLVRDGAGGGLTAGAPLASSSVIAVAAVLATASLLALSGAWWVTSLDHPRGVDLDRPEELQTARVLGEAPELVAPKEFAEATGREASSRVRPLPDTEAPARAGTRRRSPIHGQLRISGSGEVLDEALTVRLRMGDLSVKDTLVSAADGSFTSKKAFPRGYVLADVLRSAGDSAGDCEAFFDPNSDEAWIVSVPWPNLARGRLVGRNGEALTDVEVHVFQDGAEMPPERRSSPDGGTFSFSGLSLGTITVRVRRGFEQYEFSTPVRRGPNELGDVVVPFRERVGPVRGRLRSAKGGEGILVLTDLASGVTYRAEASGRFEGEFEFEKVPSGNYRLTLHAYDGLRYAAPVRFVRPPATDIEFVAIGENQPLRFRAFDGENELVANAWVLSSGGWCGLDVSLEPTDVERWIVVAEDHRPASGRTLESRHVDARLVPGWGCALLFMEGSGGAYPEEKGPIEGVEVRADGVLVARSDQDGVALLDLPHKPDELQCSLAGWVLEDDEVTAALRQGELWASSVMKRE